MSGERQKNNFAFTVTCVWLAERGFTRAAVLADSEHHCDGGELE